MVDSSADTAIATGLLLALPVVCALLLRWCRCHGWAVLGGTVAGILLGPAIFGRIDPNDYERLFIGGIQQRESLDHLKRRHGADIAAARAALIDDESLLEMRKRHESEIQLAVADLETARWREQAPLRTCTSIVIALVLLGAGLLRIRERDQRQGWIAPLSIGLWSSLLPGALAYVAMTRFFHHEPAAGAMAAAAVAIGPWVLKSVDRDAADQAEFGGAHLIQRAGRIASIIAIIAAGIAMYMQRDLEGLLWTAPLLALPLGWLAPRPKNVKHIRAVLECVFVPSLAAFASVRIELFHHFAFWPLIVFVILSGDLRWIGAFIGAKLPGGRKCLRTMRLVLGSSACGPTQLAIVALAAHLWALPHEIIFALVIGAVLAEVTTPARRSMAERIAETEEQIARVDED